MLPALIESCDSDDTVWESIAEPPFTQAGCTTINGKLVIASGLESRDSTANTVHSFDPETKKWRNLGKLAAARS